MSSLSIAFITPTKSVILPDLSTAILPDDRFILSGHITGMELAHVLGRIERSLKEVGLSADAASKLAGKPDAIRNMRRAVKDGRPGFNIATITALARVLKKTPAWLIDGRGQRDAAEAGGAVIRLVGYVGAGAETHYYAVAQGDLDEVPFPEASSDTVAVEVRGESLGLLFDRWRVFYDDVRRPVTTDSDLMGRLCVVGLADDRILIKKIKPGRKGRFRLLSVAPEPPIEDVEVDWAASVKLMVPP